MYQVSVRFYAYLNTFLSPDRKDKQFVYCFEPLRSIKDMIESLGVPHTEVALILANGETVDFDYRVQDGDRISVYPRFESIDISPLGHLQPEPHTELRFVADIHLGRLVAHLRMLGFDILYPEDYRDEELARISSEEQRILLTRDRGLLKRNIVTHGYYVRETNPWLQLEEILRRFDLFASVTQFRRCTHCNGRLHSVDKESISDHLQHNTKQYYDDFRMCQDCGKIYWKGSHYQQMEKFLGRMLSGSDGTGENTTATGDASA
jgi:uncharacterized protein